MNGKPFIVIVFFILFISLFAGGAMNTADLTPDTPPGAAGSGSNESLMFQSGGSSAGGVCGGSYTVRAGDTLSQIARACNVQLADILAANPNIVDPNLIHPGQQLAIYYNPIDIAAEPTSEKELPAVAVPTAEEMALPVTAPTAEKTIVSAEPVMLPTSPPKTTTTKSGGLRPGGSVTVQVRGLPKSTKVDVGIGKVGDTPVKVDERVTGADGTLHVTVSIPTTAQPDEKWVVTFTSQSGKKVKITSPTFTIQP